MGSHKDKSSKSKSKKHKKERKERHKKDKHSRKRDRSSSSSSDSSDSDGKLRDGGWSLLLSMARQYKPSSPVHAFNRLLIRGW